MPEANRSTTTLEGSKVLAAGQADVARIRERTRFKRILRLTIVLGVIVGFLAFRLLTHNPLHLPHLPSDAVFWLPPLLLVMALAAVMVVPMLLNARSPAVVIRPDQIEVGLSEIKGLDTQVDEVVRSLDVFLGYATFREQLGGNPRRGILFEGPPGTGKTYLAKAMAKQAGVPFLFVSAPAFQSMWFGMTAAKIRTFFKALRKAARKEGGAIGFIEEIDAIGASRSGGLGASPAPANLQKTVNNFMSPSTGGMVNELLIQMQSFDQPPWRERMWTRIVETANNYLAPEKRMRSSKPKYHNILLIAATNRADQLDAALVRPGRFDRRLYFDLPTKQGRRDLIDFFLIRKAHHEQLDEDRIRDQIAHDTLGYTPVMIEHLFDESLLVALRGSPWPRTRPATPPRRTCWGRAAGSRCCPSSSAAKPWGCSHTATSRSGSLVRGRSWRRRSPSHSEASPRRNCSSARPGPVRPRTCPAPPRSLRSWSARSAWPARSFPTRPWRRAPSTRRTSWGACSPTPTRSARSRISSTGSGSASWPASRRTATW